MEAMDPAGPVTNIAELPTVVYTMDPMGGVRPAGEGGEGGVAWTFGRGVRGQLGAWRALLAAGRLGGAGQDIETLQRILDLVAFEADRGQLSGQLLVTRAGVRAPIVLVEIDQHFEHRTTIPQGFALKTGIVQPGPQAICPLRCACRRPGLVQASGALAALVQATWQAGHPAVELQGQQMGRQGVRWPAAAVDQGVE